MDDLGVPLFLETPILQIPNLPCFFFTTSLWSLGERDLKLTFHHLIPKDRWEFSSGCGFKWGNPVKLGSTNLGHDLLIFTLPETNSSPLKIGLPNRKVVFQPSIFRGYVSFREGIYIYLLLEDLQASMSLVVLLFWDTEILISSRCDITKLPRKVVCVFMDSTVCVFLLFGFRSSPIVKWRRRFVLWHYKHIFLVVILGVLSPECRFSIIRQPLNRCLMYCCTNLMMKCCYG